MVASAAWHSWHLLQCCLQYPASLPGAPRRQLRRPFVRALRSLGLARRPSGPLTPPALPLAVAAKKCSHQPIQKRCPVSYTHLRAHETGAYL
eukprot:7315116-Pyramimonas_sp.AAC.1